MRTIQDWEIDRNKPGAPAAALLKLADSGVLTVKTISMRDIESSAKARRDGVAKDQLSRDVAAPIRKTSKPKAK